jgi:hypothetical protein
MKPGSVRTSVDIPRELHRSLRAEAAKRGCSARQLILQGIERAITESGPPAPRRRLNFDQPIIPSRGVPISLTNEQIYELIEFPCGD